MIDITYASPGDFESRAASTHYLSQVMDLGSLHTERMNKYSECWDFYDGKHWDKRAPEGFDQLVINYVKAFQRKIRRFVFRNDWTISVPNESATDIDEYLKKVWKSNDLHTLTMSIGDNAGIFGDWFIYTQWVPENDETGEKGHISLSSLDPRYVFPEYNRLTGEMEMCLVVIPFEMRQYVASTGEIRSVLSYHREIHTKDKILVQVTDNSGNVVDFKEYENEVGKILITHGINQPIPNDPFGYSDIEDLIDIQTLINEKVSNVSEIIDYHAAPITLMFGAKAQKLQKGSNKLWSGLPHNARVENLKSEGNVDSSMKFVEWLKTAMHEISNIPEDSLGGSREISNTSAVALSLDFEPLIELAEDKRHCMTIGLKAVNNLIIDLGEMYGDIKTITDTENKYEHSIEFGNLLPRDRASDINDIRAEMDLGLETKRGALIRLGDPDPDKKLQELEEEAEKAIEKQQEMFERGQQDAATNAFGKPDFKEAQKAVNVTPETHGEQVVAENIKDKS